MKLPKSRTENIVVQNAGKELLVYDLITNKALCLNETSAIIFNACDGIITLAELKHRSGFTEDLIYLGLEELQRGKLIEKVSTDHFFGLSRREAIKKVGLASMAALPVISALIAPRSADAQSLRNLALGQACTASPQCSSAAPSCLSTAGGGSASRRCCIGSVSYYNTGGTVNSCSGGSFCNSANFTCQPDANMFCCGNSATASCSGNSCACRCN